MLSMRYRECSQPASTPRKARAWMWWQPMSTTAFISTAASVPSFRAPTFRRMRVSERQWSYMGSSRVCTTRAGRHKVGVVGPRGGELVLHVPLGIREAARHVPLVLLARAGHVAVDVDPP